MLIQQNLVKSALDALERYIIDESYQGYDPYDVLNSPLFRIPFLRSSKLTRLFAQQLFKRIPFNFRPWLKISKGKNPVTLGLCVQAFSYLTKVYVDNEKYYLTEINKCIDSLVALKSKNYKGICWGYDFDWEARYSRIPAYTPTIVATGIITNGLFEYYRLTGDERSFQICKSACDFITENLNRTYDGNGFCLSYSPFDNEVVLNASMKGARLFAQIYSVTKEEKLLAHARQIINYVVKHINIDGSIPYAIHTKYRWSDNFHTGYVLDCLRDYQSLTKDMSYLTKLNKATEFYINNYFDTKCRPKYFSNKTFPIDSTAAAQSIISLVKADRLDLAEKIIMWMNSNMFDNSGFYYYRKYRLYKNQISYMRWSNAWMFDAISLYVYKKYQQ